MSATCPNCGKSYPDGSRHWNSERRRCANLASCIGRALGPMKAKTVARRMSRARLYHD